MAPFLKVGCKIIIRGVNYKNNFRTKARLFKKKQFKFGKISRNTPLNDQRGAILKSSYNCKNITT